MKVFLIVAILTIVYVLGMDIANKYIDTIPTTSQIESMEEVREDYYVSIRGAVLNPGSYRVYKDSNLNALISMAGGLKSDADMRAINTTIKLKDGEDYYIPYVAVGENNVTIKVSLNNSSKVELMSLPGIGEVYASRMIEYREEHGEFSYIEEIMKVSGIGKVSFERLKDLICL